MTAIERIRKLSSALGYVCTTLGATVLVLALGHLVLAGIDGAVGAMRPSEASDPRATSPAYEGFPEMPGYWKEFHRAFRQHFEPYYHWRRGELTGEYINASAGGVRKTTGLARASGARRLFVFGGSTVWGSGVADDQTIPSVLQSRFGDRYEVINYGETAYVSTQELNYLMHQLALGNIPDVVVFYDGVNDGYAGAYSPAIPRDPHSLRLKEAEERSLTREWFERSAYGRLVRFLRRHLLAGGGAGSPLAGAHGDWDEQVAPKIEENSRAVVEMYEAHVAQVKALGDAYGFEAYFFWQPHLLSLTRKAPNPYEARAIEEASPVLVESQRQVYLAAKQKLSGREDEGIHFLGNLFDDIDEAIYIDWIHLGPRGNERVAEEIFRRIGTRP